MHDGPTAFRFELAGNLDYESAPKLDQDWQTASSAIGDRRLIVDMTFVTSVDEKGGALLRRWHQEGASLIANSRPSRVLAESILGEPLPASAGVARVSRWW
jgi:anti-anti-sigma regulatory factor